MLFRMAIGITIGAALIATGVAKAQSSPSAHTYATRYDAMRRVVGTISPDPDGAGGNAYLAVRNSYDAAGRLVKVETGALANWQSEAVAPVSWSEFSVNKVVEIAYDTMNRKVKETVSADGTPGTVKAVTQYSYDNRGRLQCTAVRMESWTWSGLPTDACVQASVSTADVDDRITKNTYDAAGQLLKVEQGVGTAVRIDYARYEYTSNGKQKAVIDANGNRAELVYDSEDRQISWIFPSKTLVGQADPNDKEQYEYDANGNRTKLIKRDGRSIVYAYDALNRVTSKTYPSGGARDVHYTYDLRGLQLTAKFDSPFGPGVATSYDGLGRPTSSATNVSGVSRTLSYQHDANGNRTRITWPDSQYVRASWDGLDRFQFSDSSAGSNLNFVSYDAAGRVGIFYRWGGTTWESSTTYGYDGISRLASAYDTFNNSAADVTTSFTYNPASQIVSRTRNNDDYRYTNYANATRSYVANGLNQYSTVAGNSYAYDANGNLTSDGVKTYSYDIENRLTGTSTGVTLTYDPLGRLAQTYSASTGTTQFLYDGDALVAEYDGAGNMLKRYVHGPAAGVDDPLVEYIGSSMASPRHLIADHQGSIIAITDGGGNRVQVNSYDEYGVPAAGNDGRFQYTGQAWIPELGMYHYKARIYSPMLGRFLQTDPVGYEDQINLYAYVGNDPLNIRDPTGKEQCVGGLVECKKVSEGMNELRETAGKTPENSSLRETAEKYGAPGEGTVIIPRPDLPDDAFFDEAVVAGGAVVVGAGALNSGAELLGGALAHEGPHDQNYDENGTLKNLEERRATETKAYQVENEYRAAKGWGLRNIEKSVERSIEKGCRGSSHPSCK